MFKPRKRLICFFSFETSNQGINKQWYTLQLVNVENIFFEHGCYQAICFQIDEKLSRGENCVANYTRSYFCVNDLQCAKNCHFEFPYSVRKMYNTTLDHNHIECIYAQPPDKPNLRLWESSKS